MIKKKCLIRRLTIQKYFLKVYGKYFACFSLNSDMSMYPVPLDSSALSCSPPIEVRPQSVWPCQSRPRSGSPSSCSLGPFASVRIKSLISCPPPLPLSSHLDHLPNVGQVWTLVVDHRVLFGLPGHRSAQVHCARGCRILGLQPKHHSAGQLVLGVFGGLNNFLNGIKIHFCKNNLHF